MDTIQIQKPFHEVVIDELLEADDNKLREIARWLMKVALPRGTHQIVQKAWFNRCLAIHFSDHALTIQVSKHVLDQERLSVQWVEADTVARRPKRPGGFR